MTQFADIIKAHLADYKRTHFANLPDGIWRSNGQPYAHILPEDQRRLNIVEGIRDDFWAYFDAHSSDYALHTDFHHLNSSQAFAFNLFYFWMRSPETQGLILRAMGVEPKPVTSWRFEHMPDQAERTTVDFHATFLDRSELLVEVKLSESHFGGALVNEARRAKLAATYIPRLNGKVPPELLGEETFFLHYQLLRNLSHLDLTRGDTLVLLVPRANEFTWDEATRFQTSLLDTCATSVRLVAVEDLLGTLAAGNYGEAHVRHVRELTEKYMVRQPGLESSALVV